MSPILDRLARALAWHKERHRPTGFGFALADSVDYLDASAWDGLTSDASFFLRRPYLRLLEKHGPLNLKPRLALLFRGPKPVAAAAMQMVVVAGPRVLTKDGRKPSLPVSRLKARVLVCGNLLSWGQHAVAFAPDEDPAALWPGVAEALYRVRRAERLAGRTDLIMVKDIAEERPQGAAVLRHFSYNPVATDPDMVLDLSPSWKTYQDYLASLHSKYRKNALRIERDLAAAGCALEPLVDLAPEAERLHALYRQVHEAAQVKPVTIPVSYLPALAAAAGPDLRCSVIRRGGELLGFVTTLKDGATAVGYYIGFDRSKKDELPLYFRLLQAVVADAIALGCRRLSLGRTALEPKAMLGAKPAATQVWVRHAQPLVNVLVKGLLGAVPHGEAPQRNPFKEGAAGPGE